MYEKKEEFIRIVLFSQNNLNFRDSLSSPERNSSKKQTHDLVKELLPEVKKKSSENLCWIKVTSMEKI